jgi:hypothetical protein
MVVDPVHDRVLFMAPLSCGGDIPPAPATIPQAFASRAHGCATSILCFCRHSARPARRTRPRQIRGLCPTCTCAHHFTARSLFPSLFFSSWPYVHCVVMYGVCRYCLMTVLTYFRLQRELSAFIALTSSSKVVTDVAHIHSAIRSLRIFVIVEVSASTIICLGLINSAVPLVVAWDAQAVLRPEEWSIFESITAYLGWVLMYLLWWYSWPRGRNAYATAASPHHTRAAASPLSAGGGGGGAAAGAGVVGAVGGWMPGAVISPSAVQVSAPPQFIVAAPYAHWLSPASPKSDLSPNASRSAPSWPARSNPPSEPAELCGIRRPPLLATGPSPSPAPARALTTLASP